MKNRHLLPNEIDLLVDGDAGFGAAPLRAHLEECEECGQRLGEAMFVADALESLPHFAPDSRLANRIMAQVPVFIPAHVAARDSVMRWLPRLGRLRIAAGLLLMGMGAVCTVGLLWLASKGDAFVFMSQLVGERIQGALGGAMRAAAAAVLGDSVLTALQSSGASGVALVLGGFVVTAIGALLALRKITTAPSRS